MKILKKSVVGLKKSLNVINPKNKNIGETMLVISGTNRKNSNSRKIANIAKESLEANSVQVEIIDLADLEFSSLAHCDYGLTDQLPPLIGKAIQHVNLATGIVIICPEYNGSLPGTLKFFIDHWAYPLSFQRRPFSLIGIGGRFGGLRAVEHLQQILGYRDAFVYPERTFITEVYKKIQGEKLVDEVANELIAKQMRGFLEYTKKLGS